MSKLPPTRFLLVLSLIVAGVLCANVLEHRAGRTHLNFGPGYVPAAPKPAPDIPRPDAVYR